MFNLKLQPTSNKRNLAAIDLGSNSFHLIIAKIEGDQLLIQDKIKESVRLGFGLKYNGELSEEARLRALDCLSRFGERLKDFTPGSVRTVGTKTLRSLADAEEFLAQAENRLGHSIEIVSGEEEARLIYAGVSRNLAFDGRHRILMDIGGGSTEIIIGKDMNPELKESLSMGCVQVMRDFFSDGKVTNSRIKTAHTYCLQEIEPILDSYLDHGWDVVLGSSGSIKAASKVCEAMGFSKGVIEKKFLTQIINIYKDQGDLDVDIKGLADERKPVFLGGCIVLRALFESLKLKEMTASDWSLREGLLYDLVGRIDNKDIRDSSVSHLAKRFRVNSSHAARVKDTALNFLDQLAEPWQLSRPESDQLLSWASDLVFVGLDITHSDYHKHGAYVVEHVDLAGFSRQEQAQLAALILAHRKRFPLKVMDQYKAELIFIAIILRLAVLFNRTRLKEGLPELDLEIKKNKLRVLLPTGWLEKHPLTLADLETEKRRLNAVDIELLYPVPDTED